MMQLCFFVAGEPATKGSFRAFNTAKGARVTNANPKTKDWEMRIAHECQAALDDWTPCYEGAVAITCVFNLPRPKSMPKKIVHHVKKPDVDKLMRAVLDGITGIAIKDDSQVNKLSGDKQYADEDNPVGVHILVTAL